MHIDTHIHAVSCDRDIRRNSMLAPENLRIPAYFRAHSKTLSEQATVRQIGIHLDSKHRN